MSLVAESASCQIPAGLLLTAGMDPHFIAKFCLFTALLLLGAVGIGKVLKKLFKLPSIAGQIIGGIILGPSVIDIAHSDYFGHPLRLVDFATGNASSILTSDLCVFFILLISSALTVSYLMWVAGHETEVKDIMKIGITAVSAGFFGAVLPIIMTAGLVYYGLSGWDAVESIGLGLVFAATSVSIPVAMLFAYNQMHLKSSKATLGAAVVDDILAVILLSVFFLFAQSGFFGVHELSIEGHSAGITEALAYMIGSFAVILSIGYFIIPPFIQWLKDSHYAHLITLVATAIMLLYFSFAELVGGLAGVTGAYFAGLFHRMGDSHHRAEKTIAPFVNSILLPLFLASIGLQIDVRVLSLYDWVIIALLLVVAVISKLLGCWFATQLSNTFSRNKGGAHRWRVLETYLFGSSMVARGEVGLVIATILYGAQVLNPHQYVISVVVIVLTTIVAPIMLGIGFAYLKTAPTKVEGTDEYVLNMGTFSVIGTSQMYNIIIGLLEASGQYKTEVSFSEGRKIANVQGKRVKVVLCPQDGVLLEGNKAHISEIIDLVKKSVVKDLGKISAHTG